MKTQFAEVSIQEVKNYWNARLQYTSLKRRVGTEKYLLIIKNLMHWNLFHK